MSDGRRQIGDFYYPDELFGVEAGDKHRFSADALSDCVILVLKASALRAAAGEEAYERLVRRATSHELDRTQEHLLLLGRKTACERVASFLIGLADLTEIGKQIGARLMTAPIEIYLTLFLIYFVVNRGISWATRLLETRERFNKLFLRV